MSNGDCEPTLGPMYRIVLPSGDHIGSSACPFAMRTAGPPSTGTLNSPSPEHRRLRSRSIADPATSCCRARPRNRSAAATPTVWQTAGASAFRCVGARWRCGRLRVRDQASPASDCLRRARARRPRRRDTATSLCPSRPRTHRRGIPRQTGASSRSRWTRETAARRARPRRGRESEPSRAWSSDWRPWPRAATHPRWPTPTCMLINPRLIRRERRCAMSSAHSQGPAPLSSRETYRTVLARWESDSPRRCCDSSVARACPLPRRCATDPFHWSTGCRRRRTPIARRVTRPGSAWTPGFAPTKICVRSSRRDRPRRSDRPGRA